MPPDSVSATRYYKLLPKMSEDRRRVIGLEISPGTKSEPDWADGPFVKVTFKVAREVFRPMVDVEIELDSTNIATPEVILADLKELKDSLR